MESRMVKFYSKESNMVAIHAIPGHFATSHKLEDKNSGGERGCPCAASEDRKSFLCGYDCMYGRHGGDRSVFGRGI